MNTLDAFERFYSAIFGEVAEKTRRWYRAVLQSFIDEYGRLPVSALTIKHCRAWRNDQVKRLDDGISIHTIHAHLRALKRFFNWMVDEGILDASPAARLRLPKLPDQQPKAIAAADLQRLLLYTYQVSKRDYAIMCFLADTGCRAGGLCTLVRENLYLDNGRAIVTEKGEKMRVVYFGRLTYTALVAYLAERTDDGAYVFVGRKGPLKPDGIRQMLRRRAKDAGVEGRVNPHSFRHAFAREYLRNGGDLTTLGRLMGHAPGSPVTAKSYAVWADDELREFHERYSPLREPKHVDILSKRIDANTD